MTIEQSIYLFSQTQPEKVAIVSGTTCVTYGELWQNILLAREYFANLPNYRRASRVVIAANKQVEFLYAYFGAHMANLVAVPVDSEINPNRLEYICHKVTQVHIIGLEKMMNNAASVSLKIFSNLNSNVASEDIVFPADQDIADMLFTTGTTGEPKCVPLTFCNEWAAATNINSYIGNTTADKELLALPISHSFGLGRIRCCLQKGQTLYLLGSFANVKRFFRIMEEEQITGFAMVPASWKFLQSMSGDKLSAFACQLRYVEMGSAFLSPEDKYQLSQLLPQTRIAMHYGLTEASRSAFLEFHDTDHLESVGKAAPNTDIKIFDPEGRQLPFGQDGEIGIKGVHVMQCYWGAKKDECFYGDYFRTGDYGSMDKEGYLTLKSRMKELINVGGKKVSPIEVEEQLLCIDGIKDCACVAMADPNGILGEVVKACVVLSDKSLKLENINSQLSGKLESYKIPAKYEIVSEIPRTHNGKIQRIALR